MCVTSLPGGACVTGSQFVMRRCLLACVCVWMCVRPAAALANPSSTYTTVHRSSTACNSLQTAIVGLPNVGKVGGFPLYPWHAVCRRQGCNAYIKMSTYSILLHNQANTHHTIHVVFFLHFMQSTLFNAIVQNGKAAAANFPFCSKSCLLL